MYRKKKAKHRSDAARHEPAPILNRDAVIVLDLVMEDIEHGHIPSSVHYRDGIMRDLQRRSGEGFKKYGTVLTVDNGRDSLMDTYQEVLDAIAYMRQFHYEYPDNNFAFPLYTMLWDCAQVLWDEMNAHD